MRTSSLNRLLDRSAVLVARYASADEQGLPRAC